MTGDFVASEGVEKAGYTFQHAKHLLKIVVFVVYYHKENVH